MNGLFHRTRGTGLLFLAALSRRIWWWKGWDRALRWIHPPDRPAADGFKAVIGYGSRSLLFVDTANFIEWSVFFKGHYQAFYDQLLHVLLRPGMIVVEIGANNGTETVLMAELVGDSGRVLAVEPNPVAIDRLRRNLRINHLANVSIVSVALGAECGQIDLRVLTGSLPTASVDTPGAHEQAKLVPVEMLDFDALLQREPLERLDFIKIDTDGFEIPVLVGAKRAMTRFRPRILFEFDVRCWGTYGSSWATACDVFDEMNYELYAITPNRYSLCLTPVSRSQAPPDSTDVLAIPLS